MEKYDFIIVGAGASGSMCAINLANKGYKVLVIDKYLFPAKKLLVTGNGRCNLTNSDVSSKFYNQNIDSFLNKFGYKQTIEFFQNIGIITYLDEQGRCYPITNSATSVVDAIKNQFSKLRIDFLGGQEFIDLDMLSDGYMVKTQDSSYSCDNVIFACGGNSILDCLSKLRLQTKPFMPSLCALKTVENTKSLAGVRVQNVLVEYEVGSTRVQDVGEILFKEQGISGICIFNLSCLGARNENYNGKLTVDFLPQISEDNLVKLIQNHTYIFENVSEVLTGIVNEKIANEVLKRAKINKNTQKNALNYENICKIAHIIKHFELTVCDAYDNNQVFSGGVELNSLNENLESKSYPNMFFCGEIVDVDGECGGYNLQWAFSSANAVCSKFTKKS